MHSSAADSHVSPARRQRWACAAEIGLIFLVFFIHGAWPTPDANEPHYLGKARHFWDPAWCAGDFFLNTANAHAMFYWSFGWLSRWLPLASWAWTGRLLVWALTAWAWRRLSWSLVPASWYAILSAALLVALNDRFQMSGEWLIGGVEGKGFAYVLVFLGLESLIVGRWGAAWLMFGAASAFHVVVGGWATMAAMLVWLSNRDAPPLARMIPALAGGLLLALPGLIPALALTWNVEPDFVREANQIYVFDRLSHHLVPQRFVPQFVVRHLLLVAALVLLFPLAGSDERWRRLRGFVAAAVGMAAIGMLIGMVVERWPDLSAALLRYYWFRLSDVMVPAGVALCLVSILRRWQAVAPARHAGALVAMLVIAGAHLAQMIWLRQHTVLPPGDSTLVQIANLPESSDEADVERAAAILADWRDVCQWAATETPPDALFITPRLSQTFRWYAGRGEVVNRKDLPQDALGIIEWWRRLQRIHLQGAGTTQTRWRESLTELQPDELRALGREFGAQYVVTAARPPLALPRVGPRASYFAIYQLFEPPAR
jgi:hypothetical protein